MGKIMEAIFCVVYIIAVFVLGILTIARSKGKREQVMYGIMSLVLVGGDSFHLIPRILVAIKVIGADHPSLGIGKLITSITMTLFYLLLYFIFSERYKFHSQPTTMCMVLLSVARIALCLFPQNDWTGEAPIIWGIYRNIPFLMIGIIMVVLFFKKRADKPFKWMWLAITLSFGFYIPVVLWADANPIVGMLMMPKTCMYVWIVLMGLLNGYTGTTAKE